MPRRSRIYEQHDVIPIGVVLVVVGFIILAGVAGYLGFSLLKTAEPSVSAAPLPVNPGFTSSPSTIVQAVAVTPTPNATTEKTELPILLPESSLYDAGLPSFASAFDAPTSLAVNIANRPVRLVIPSLNIDVRVRSVGLLSYGKGDERYYQWQVPRGYEVGWHNTSAPLGQPGNTVLNGHNNIYGEVFRYLIDVAVGEQIFLYDEDQAYVYQVTQQELLPENGQPLAIRTQNAKWIEATNDERITLVSCWPYATNAYRLVVVAKAVDG